MLSGTIYPGNVGYFPSDSRPTIQEALCGRLATLGDVGLNNIKWLKSIKC